MYLNKDFELPIYDNIRISIVLTDDEQILDKKLGLIWDSENPLLGAVCLASNKKTKKRTIFVLFNPTSKYFNMGVVVHEAVHAANRVFHAIGHNPDLLNDEPQAYLTEYIFSQCVKFLEKYKDECNKETTGS